MSEFVVVFIHALKNSLIPVITYLGPLTASILTGGICGRERIQCTRAWTIFCQFHQQPGLYHDHGCDDLLLSTDRML